MWQNLWDKYILYYTLFGSIYKKQLTFYIYWILNIFGLYSIYIPDTLIIRLI